MYTKVIAQNEEEQYRYYRSILWEGIKTGVFGLAFGITLATEDEDEAEQQVKRIYAEAFAGQQAKDWLYDHQFQVLGGTWATTMAVALTHMKRDHSTRGARKLVQARVAAEVSTLAVLLLTAVLEAKDRKEGGGKYQRVIVVNRRKG
ncbi:hypothetical protein QWA68_016899 [Fusarium oxysporum]|nr:hypothetical protein QWA68_016899 [Fusarium oxysporum]